MGTGSAGPGFGSGTTGKLGRAWVQCMVHGILGLPYLFGGVPDPVTSLR